MATHINYVELPAPDLEAAKNFYFSAFGWDFIDYGPVYASHVEPSGVEIGLNAASAAAPQADPGAEDCIGPLVLFGTDNIEATESAVLAAGGTICSPIYEYPGGRRFHFLDPAGSTLGVYQSNPT